jgi:hypothetical protein
VLTATIRCSNIARLTFYSHICFGNYDPAQVVSERIDPVDGELTGDNLGEVRDAGKIVEHGGNQR